MVAFNGEEWKTKKWEEVLVESRKCFWLDERDVSLVGMNSWNKLPYRNMFYKLGYHSGPTPALSLSFFKCVNHQCSIDRYRHGRCKAELITQVNKGNFSTMEMIGFS